MLRLTDRPINVTEVIAQVGDPTSGATAVFIGTTRDHNEDRRVTGLEYEAYPGMVERELQRLSYEARKRWKITEMAIVHRVGPVAIGEASVVIAVSAAHRPEAFAACRFAIEELKRTVPIWKKETFEGGEVWIGTQTDKPLPREWLEGGSGS